MINFNAGTGSNVTRVSTRVGSITRNSGGVIYPSERLIFHPERNGTARAFEVSMIMTTIPIVFTNLVQPIALGSAFIGDFISATLAGWGRTTTTPNSVATTLQFLHVPTLMNGDCRSRHTPGNAALIHDSTICTYLRRNTGHCVGKIFILSFMKINLSFL